MIEISCCMIVKNEEKILARCLDSIADLMEEIIIVDTGSTDATKEIAARYTDKIYDFTWVDDFSAARNFAFSKATKEYIYSADADEVLNKENRQRFRELKEVLLPEIDIVQMKYGNQLSFGTTYNFDEEYRPKLFKRLREFIWTEPIHEMVRLDPLVYDSDIVIEHRPESNHSKRDFATFQKHIKKGLRLSKRLHHMYAMELYISGEDEDFLEAEEFFTSTALDAGRSLDEVKEAACIVCHAARLRGDSHTLLKMSLKDLLSEGSSEMCYELGEYFFALSDYEEAAMWYYNAIHETQSILNIHTSTDWPEEKLAQCQQMADK
ncbi:MAG: glycosyltransferase family 2 protein [Lachnospiraceae bacterium]|nr:glycosyltransferase family 2 protein [Lachnospiraceae bacterium]